MASAIRFSSLIFFFCLLTVGVDAAEDSLDGPPELVQLRKDLGEAVARFDGPIHELNKTYQRHLEKQKSVFQQEGNLDSVLAIEEEMKNFETSEAELSKLPELGRLQKIYREQKQKLLTEREQKALPVIASYQQKAGTLAREWTRFNRIEDAKLAQVEAEALAARLKSVSVPFSQPTDSMFSLFAGKRVGEEFRNSIGMELCWCPSGEFTMGSPLDEEGRHEDETQVHVTLTKGFWIGKYEATQEEYERLMDENPSTESYRGRKDFPVDNVSWKSAREFCVKLTERERKNGKIPQGWRYDLPTEAQWEYACRAGTEGPFAGDPPSDYGWFGHGKAEPVGLKKPNQWGIHDMHGNYRELAREEDLNLKCKGYFAFGCWFFYRLGLGICKGGAEWKRA